MHACSGIMELWGGVRVVKDRISYRGAHACELNMRGE